MTPSEHVHEVQIHGIAMTGTSVETCPTCDQPIPPDRIAEINGKIAARDRLRNSEITNRLNEQFARERAADRAAAQRSLEQERAQAAEALLVVKADATRNEEAIRSQERQDAEAHFGAKLAEADRLRQESETALRQELIQSQQKQRQLEAENQAPWQSSQISLQNPPRGSSASGLK